MSIIIKILLYDLSNIEWFDICGYTLFAITGIAGCWVVGMILLDFSNVFPLYTPAIVTFFIFTGFVTCLIISGSIMFLVWICPHIRKDIYKLTKQEIKK